MEQAERKINLFVIPRHRPKCLVKQDKRKSNLSNRHLKTLAKASGGTLEIHALDELMDGTEPKTPFVRDVIAYAKVNGVDPAVAAEALLNERGEAQMMVGNSEKNSNLGENSGQENESRNRRNGATAERGQQAGDFGLLNESLLRVERRDGDVRGASKQGVQSEESAERRNSEDERTLEELAKEQGEWLDEADEELERRYGKPIGSGAESFVYRKNANTVVKSRTIDPNIGGGYKSYQEALESIAIHNRLFPETAMKIVGFGRSDGEFCVLIEQPRIEGKFATTEEIQQFVAEQFGAEKDESVLGGQSYKNEDYLLQDLKPKNVIVKAVDGQKKLFVIDGDFYYTEEGRKNHSEGLDLSNVRLMKGKSGTVYGWCETEYDENGNFVANHIYLNPKTLNSNTMVHELGHLWINLLRAKNKELYDKGISLAKEHWLFNEYKESQEYGRLSDEEIGERKGGCETN